jgi:hypothetical protein
MVHADINRIVGSDDWLAGRPGMSYLTCTA